MIFANLNLFITLHADFVSSFCFRCFVLSYYISSTYNNSTNSSYHFPHMQWLLGFFALELSIHPQPFFHPNFLKKEACVPSGDIHFRSSHFIPYSVIRIIGQFLQIANLFSINVSIRVRVLYYIWFISIK